MSNWADFAISAVKRGPGLGQISQIRIHKDEGDKFGPAEIVAKDLPPSFMGKPMVIPANKVLPAPRDFGLLTVDCQFVVSVLDNFLSSISV